MGRTSRKRSTLANRAIVASAALVLGGGGLAGLNVYASAGEARSGQPDSARTQNTWQQMSTIDCPDVGNQLPEVPDGSRQEVDTQLATLDSQITEAYKRFADSKDQLSQDPNLAQSSILVPLKDERLDSIDRIANAIGQNTERPQGLDGLAPCTLRADDSQGNGQGGASNSASPTPSASSSSSSTGQSDQGSGQGGDQANQGNGPEAADFVNIKSVRPNVSTPRRLRAGSSGAFASNCGRNQNGKFNPDNVIVAPGVSNGAHHMHDYVGNQATDAFASDQKLADGQTSCRNQGDKSTYYWPVLRLQNGQKEKDADTPGGGQDKNTGIIQTPAQVTLNWVGSPVAKVVAMPRFLRIITGDAKAFTNGDANANASWSCTGFENRQLKDKYPICPRGSKVVRTFKFQSCWDGQNTDSANHRTHVAFADRNGACQGGFKAIPQLVQRIVYAVPPGPGFAVDSFPEQLHKPITDHGDFINVFSDQLMKKVVGCINSGRRCT
ncbi:DUF1996 domain-containing protein [Streptomyces beijiangensis]|uniref:DUF1996 domain-containing protein n=1 Tax=Streptomyces beijiangensis TaxID=163361 RepID=A0A939JI80_9ACTN|nr:DUF1996 domain-containing protein [Streptomyces beijiangensis]MBO0512900.1 DUF1996 domain-containing protein [Streptomyces beijiangensis]